MDIWKAHGPISTMWSDTLLCLCLLFGSSVFLLRLPQKGFEGASIKMDIKERSHHRHRKELEADMLTRNLKLSPELSASGAKRRGRGWGRNYSYFLKSDKMQRSVFLLTRGTILDTYIKCAGTWLGFLIRSLSHCSGCFISGHLCSCHTVKQSVPHWRNFIEFKYSVTPFPGL